MILIMLIVNSVVFYLFSIKIQTKHENNRTVKYICLCIFHKSFESINYWHRFRTKKNWRIHIHTSDGMILFCAHTRKIIVSSFHIKWHLFRMFGLLLIRSFLIDSFWESLERLIEYKSVYINVISTSLGYFIETAHKCSNGIEFYEFILKLSAF